LFKPRLGKPGKSGKPALDSSPRHEYCNTQNSSQPFISRTPLPESLSTFKGDSAQQLPNLKTIIEPEASEVELQPLNLHADY